MAKNDKIYKEYSIEFNLISQDRRSLRDQAVHKFLSEKGGYWEDGKKHVTRYKYFVEKINDGRRVFLLRPTYLNKGIDFQVLVEKMNGEDDDRPSHTDIFVDLELKKKEDDAQYMKLKEAIDEVWNCVEPDQVLKKHTFTFKEGFQVELLLKMLKWLFIEQDITYWNYDGRGMLKQHIDKI